MSNADLKVGDKVMLSHDTDWHISEENPLGIIGVVVMVGERIDVDWGNGESNEYYKNDSDLIKQ